MASTTAESSSAERIWHVKVGGKKIGPLSDEEVCGLALSRKVKPSSLAWKHGMQDWLACSSIPELARRPMRTPDLRSSSKPAISGESLLLGGVGAPLPAPLELSAGPLRAVFEPDSGFLRYVRLGEREVLRGVYAAVRDDLWGTVPNEIANLRVESGADFFDVRFGVRCRRGGIDFSWAGSVTGSADGTIVYEFRGRAVSSFLTNRTGFCVLHPIAECAGRPCRLTHPDGRLEESRFPDAIAPHQPFRDLRAIAHELAPGLWAEVTFEGEVFETEDQRNWTDASYKTYCRPLALPFPYRVEAGEEVVQRVTLRLVKAGVNEPAISVCLSAADNGEIPVTRLHIEDGTGRSVVPNLGLCATPDGGTLTAREVARLRSLCLGHLRVDLDLADPTWPQTWNRAAADAAALGVPLHGALLLGHAPEGALAEVARCAASNAVRVAAWLVFRSREETAGRDEVALVRQALGSDAPIGVGSNVYFVQLNRRPPEPGVGDFVCYAVTPQVHAFDNASLTETLPIQADTAVCARTFGGGRRVAVGPVTLRPRFVPLSEAGQLRKPDAVAAQTGNAAEASVVPGRNAVFPASVDVRQLSLFGAAWTLGSLKHLAEAGADWATYYETAGWRGVVEREAGCAAPHLFPSLAGAVFPLYHVLRWVGEWRDAQVVRCRSSRPLAAEGLILRRKEKTRVLLANFTDAPQRLCIDALGHSGQSSWRLLDATTLDEATRNPEAFAFGSVQLLQECQETLSFDLPPYAVACGDLTDRLSPGKEAEPCPMR